MASSVFIWPGMSGIVFPGAITVNGNITAVGSVTANSLILDATNADTTLARGGASGKLLLTGTTPMLQLGGTTSSQVAIRQSGTTLLCRLADDSGACNLSAAQVQAGTTFSTNTAPFISSTAPTVTSAGSSPSVANVNGTVAFRVNVGTGGVATTIVMAMPAATTGWNAYAENITGTAANRADSKMALQSSTTNSLTLQYQTVSTGAALAFTASDIVAVIAFAF